MDGRPSLRLDLLGDQAGIQAPLERREASSPPSCLLEDPSAQAVLDAEVLALQANGTVEGVRLSSSPGFYGRLFVVRKRFWV
jgi:hypothetical protein